MMPYSPSIVWIWRAFAPVTLLLLALLSGCNVAGLAAQAMPPAQVDPQYKGMAGETVAVMVWVDRAVRIDWPTMQLDLGTAIHQRLEDAVTSSRKPPRELLGTQFPVRPASVVRFQKDNPELDAYPVTEIAPRLGVSRLVYVEIEDFSTRSLMAASLFRGSITGTLRIIEIAPDGTAKIAYEENNISAVFPPKSPEEGVLNTNDYAIYVGTLREFTQQITDRLMRHEERTR